MDSQRVARVGEVLRYELSELVRLRVKDPRLGFVTITHVEVSADLRHAKVHVSSLGTPEEASRSIEVLSGAAGFLRSELFKRVRLRFIPELSFKIDRSIEHSVRISQVLRELKDESERRES
ncbi:MAG: 30S ribosome-binding factor RbfA [Candidatus Eisenbacteria bacterium]|nr:30S ribosome-binding factor RbfA [Candidatus Eisenbacteria bacterium]